MTTNPAPSGTATTTLDCHCATSIDMLKAELLSLKQQRNWVTDFEQKLDDMWHKVRRLWQIIEALQQPMQFPTAGRPIDKPAAH